MQHSLHFHARKEAIERMNRLGSEGRPFFFSDRLSGGTVSGRRTGEVTVLGITFCLSEGK